MNEAVECRAADGHVVYGTLSVPQNPVAAVLLVHGITADRSEWGYFDVLRDQLAETGIASLAIDYRGHGESAYQVDHLTLSGVGLDITAAFELLDGSVPSTLRRAIVGNSFGGGMSYLFGVAEARVAAIVLTMPVLSYVDDIERVNDRWSSRPLHESIPYGPVKLPGLIRADFFAADELIARAHTNKPLTILHGEADTDVPFNASEQFLSSSPSKGELIGLPSMDHCWAAPGDPNRKTAQSRENQRIASDRTAAILRSHLQ
ncbi:MAG: alpha/beta hydrolase family protein [Solirubrobacterales bacterium]